MVNAISLRGFVVQVGAVCLVAGSLWPTLVQAAEVNVSVAIKDHHFVPAEIKGPAGQKFKLTVHNQDAKAEEFESKALAREKLVPAGAKVVIPLGPLKPGRYAFVGEYHEATAQGVLVVE